MSLQHFLWTSSGALWTLSPDERVACLYHPTAYPNIKPQCIQCMCYFCLLYFCLYLSWVNSKAKLTQYMKQNLTYSPLSIYNTTIRQTFDLTILLWINISRYFSVHWESFQSSRCDLRMKLWSQTGSTKHLTQGSTSISAAFQLHITIFQSFQVKQRGHNVTGFIQIVSHTIGSKWTLSCRTTVSKVKNDLSHSLDSYCVRNLWMEVPYVN